jgi:hypothetical protein
MKHTVEMGSSAMIYITSFIKTGSDIQKLLLLGGGDTNVNTQQGDLISQRVFFSI